jgi:hypothetical protein
MSIETDYFVNIFNTSMNDKVLQDKVQRCLQEGTCIKTTQADLIAGKAKCLPTNKGRLCNECVYNKTTGQMYQKKSLAKRCTDCNKFPSMHKAIFIAKYAI